MGVKTPEPGIYEGVPFSEYIRWPCLSVSTLKAFSVSPAQLVYEQTIEGREGRKVSDDMRLGSAVDRLVFEGKDAFEAGFIACPEGMKRDERHEKYQAFLARAGDREVMKPADFDRAKWIAASVMMHPLLRNGAMKGKTQVSMAWVDPETGLMCKSRPDMYDPSSDPIIWDLKVTTAAAAGEFERHAEAMRWHWQAYWYLTGCSVLTGFGHHMFRDIAVRSAPVHSAHIHEFSEDFIGLAEDQVRPLVRQYAELQSVPREEWPACDGEVHIAEPRYGRRRSW